MILGKKEKVRGPDDLSGPFQSRAQSKTTRRRGTPIYVKETFQRQVRASYFSLKSIPSSSSSPNTPSWIRNQLEIKILF